MNEIKNLVSRIILIDIQDPELLIKYPFAGYILFYKDIDQSINGWKKLKEFNNYYQMTFQNKYGMDLFRSIDQEGGIVFRFDYQELPAICSQYWVSNEDEAYNLAKLNGSILRFLNFNLNFSPVMDVNTNFLNPIIGVRSFGSNSKKVSSLSRKYIQAYHDSNIICTGKHFPGHGDTDKDSHIDLPVSILTDDHILPFLENKQILPSIMTAHVVYKNYDNLPATISKKVLDIYQPYDGLVFSDALNMNALKNYNWYEVLLKALYSGVDVLLILGQDELKIDSINFLAKEVLKDSFLLKIITKKNQKINQLLQKFNHKNGLLNNIHQNKEQSELIQNIRNLTKWMKNRFNINMVEQKGNKHLLKHIFSQNEFNVLILSSEYIDLIGIKQKVIDIFKRVLKDKNIKFFDANLPDCDFSGLSIIVNLLHSNQELEKKLSFIKEKVIFSFSNPYLSGDYVVNFGGFCGIHLEVFEKWLKEEFTQLRSIEIL